MGIQFFLHEIVKFKSVALASIGMHLYFVDLVLQQLVGTLLLRVPPLHLQVMPGIQGPQPDVQDDDIGLGGKTV